MKEILTRATQGASPLLQDLMLTPGEKYYAFSVVDLEKRQRFSCERRFLIELLDSVPQEEIEEYFKKIISQIRFQNKFLASQAPQKRFEILFFVFREHLVSGNSFFIIRQKFFRPPFCFPDEGFPDKSSLCDYYGMFLSALKEKWPETAQKYHLDPKKEGLRYARVALRRFNEGIKIFTQRELARHYLEKIVTYASPLEALVLRALLMGRPSLIFEKLRVPHDFFSQRYPYFLRGDFLRKISRWVKEKYLPSAKLIHALKLWLFSENRALVSGVKSPWENFCELLEEIDKEPLRKLPKAQLNQTRIYALRHLRKYLGLEGAREILSALPKMNPQERLDLIKELISQAPPKVRLKEKTVRMYVGVIGNIIADIEDGLGFPEILLVKNERKHAA